MRTSGKRLAASGHLGHAAFRCVPDRPALCLTCGHRMRAPWRTRGVCTPAVLALGGHPRGRSWRPHALIAPLRQLAWAACPGSCSGAGPTCNASAAKVLEPHISPGGAHHRVVICLLAMAASMSVRAGRLHSAARVHLALHCAALALVGNHDSNLYRANLRVPALHCRARQLSKARRQVVKTFKHFAGLHCVALRLSGK